MILILLVSNVETVSCLCSSSNSSKPSTFTLETYCPHWHWQRDAIMWLKLTLTTSFTGYSQPDFECACDCSLVCFFARIKSLWRCGYLAATCHLAFKNNIIFMSLAHVMDRRESVGGPNSQPTIWSVGGPYACAVRPELELQYVNTLGVV